MLRLLPNPPEASNNNEQFELEAIKKQLKVELVELGVEVAERTDLGELNGEIQAKLNYYKSKKSQIIKKEDELVFLESRSKLNSLLQEIISREKSISIEEEHIRSLNDKLSKNKEELKKIVDESDAMKLWLDEHHLDFGV